MAFIVEDGTGMAEANAYISIEEFKTHFTDRGIDYTLETDTDIQAWIVNASDYVDKRFGRRFRGWRRSRTQALEWPRTDACDDDDYLFAGVPVQLKKAIAEYASLVKELARNLAPVPGTEFGIIDPSTGTVTTTPSGALTSRTEKVGPIEDSASYESAHRPMVSTGNLLTQRIPEYPQADLWIEELIVSTSSKGIVRG